MAYENLPDIDFAVKDPALIEQDILANAKTSLGRDLADGDPARLFIKVLVYVASMIRSNIDSTGKQNLIKYAAGDYLDNYAADFDVFRNPAQPATCTLRFTLSAPQASIITIPQGTRATPDNEIYFATQAVAQVPIGDTYVDVLASCINIDADGQSIGATANGIAAGNINTIVDPVPFVDTVVNLGVTAGGIDTESDDSLKDRRQTALERFSTAGATSAYSYWAKTYSQNVIDVGVHSPTPGVVHVIPLMTGGTLPSAADLTGIATILSDEKIRPLTDNLFVLPPTQISYNIALTYYVRVSDSLNATAIQSAVNQAIADYQVWQKSKIGRDINPSELIARVMQAGAKRVTLTAPADVNLSNSQVAVVNTVSVTYGGLEDI